MNTTPSAIRKLAGQLIGLEADHREIPAGNRCAALRVCEKLRLPLSKQAGIAGFRSLMSRALAIAKVASPSLDGIQVRPDGSLEDFVNGQNREEGAADVLVAQLLGLLVTFIGKPLTMRLVCDAWPSMSLTGTNESVGENS